MGAALLLRFKLSQQDESTKHGHFTCKRSFIVIRAIAEVFQSFFIRVLTTAFVLVLGIFSSASMLFSASAGELVFFENDVMANPVKGESCKLSIDRIGIEEYNCNEKSPM